MEHDGEVVFKMSWFKRTRKPAAKDQWIADFPEHYLAAGVTERLKYGAGTLEFLDKRRAADDNPFIGLAVEKLILDTELADLERATEAAQK